MGNIKLMLYLVLICGLLAISSLLKNLIREIVEERGGDDNDANNPMCSNGVRFDDGFFSRNGTCFMDDSCCSGHCKITVYAEDGSPGHGICVDAPKRKRTKIYGTRVNRH
ncbi:unnamed protein product [Adineta ricciae]|uniref:Uncharacterized protein n=1 Tax=Adineta ricciae TaxID=249248 RepID=A0A815NJH7_ADIRI|nr:unnamed protein product [Adineta ricciae]CAF1438745.1 unnamed protein product [Adineta ricciae]